MSEELLSGLAIALRKRRKALGLAHKAVFLATRISSLSRIESGQHALNLRTFFRLAAFYGVTPSELLVEAEKISECSPITEKERGTA